MTKEADLALPNLSIIGSAPRPTQLSQATNVFLSLQGYNTIAHKAGYDGNAITPTRRTTYEAHGVDTSTCLAFHQSFRSERTPLGILAHPNKLLAAQAFLTFRHRYDSLVTIHQLQELHADTTGDILPIVFQIPDDIRHKSAEPIKNKVLITSPENYSGIGAQSVADYNQKVKDLGFDGGHSVDLYQLQRRNINGSKSPFQNLDHSLPLLWGNTSIAIISFRDDFGPNYETPEVQVKQFLETNGSDVSFYLEQLRRLMNSTGHVPLFEIQVPHSVVAAHYRSPIATQDMVVELHNKLQQKVRSALKS